MEQVLQAGHCFTMPVRPVLLSPYADGEAALRGNSSTQGQPPEPLLFALQPPRLYACSRWWLYLLVRSLREETGSISPYHDSVWPASKWAWGQRS